MVAVGLWMGSGARTPGSPYAWRVSLGLDSHLAGGTGTRGKLRLNVVVTICAGALLGATMSRYVVAPVFAVTATMVTASLLTFRFGPAEAEDTAAEAS